MTLLPQLRDQLDSAAHRQAAASSRSGGATVRVSHILRRRWWARLPTLGTVATAVMVLVTVTIGVGTLVLLSHRRPASQPVTSASPASRIAPTSLSRGALSARVSGLHGHSVVITVWASWCQPCRGDLGLVSSAAKRYGEKVTFLGADVFDTPRAADSFLRHEHLDLPSYRSSLRDLQPIVGGLPGIPQTIFISPAGHVVFVHDGEYDSRASLDRDIARYSLAGAAGPTAPNESRR